MVSRGAEESGVGSAAEGVSSSTSLAMQSNGIFHANGTRSSGEFAVNGLGGVVTSNGCDGDLFEGEEAVKMGASAHVEKVLSRKRKQRQLTGKDRDVIRLVGQHLREMGFV